jgi:hypothetical protein
MGANSTIYVRVLVSKEEWIEVSALHLDDAMERANKLPGVVRALEASYQPGGEVV